MDECFFGFMNSPALYGVTGAILSSNTIGKQTPISKNSLSKENGKAILELGRIFL